MSFKRKIKRREAADQRAAAGIPKKGKLLKKLRKDRPKSRRQHLERLQQFALWISACLINATGAHDVKRVLVDARKDNFYLERLIEAQKALEEPEITQTLTNEDLPEETDDGKE